MQLVWEREILWLLYQRRGLRYSFIAAPMCQDPNSDSIFNLTVVYSYWWGCDTYSGQQKMVEGKITNNLTHGWKQLFSLWTHNQSASKLSPLKKDDNKTMTDRKRQADWFSSLPSTGSPKKKGWGERLIDSSRHCRVIRMAQTISLWTWWTKWSQRKLVLSFTWHFWTPLSLLVAMSTIMVRAALFKRKCY